MRKIFLTFCFLIKNAFSGDLCFLPRKVGFCRGMFQRWYYDSSKGACTKFYYGGCNGNENNFFTKSDCKKHCQGFSCKSRYEAIGCYIHNQSPQLGYVLLNERDLGSQVFGGTLVNWLKWTQYLPSMLCRCAKKAADNGFKMFAIYNIAECWGANHFNQEHFNKSTTCLDRFYGHQCQTTTDMCVGGPQAHYFYKITNK